MTVAYLCLAFLLPTGSIVLDVMRDAAKEATEREITRLSAELPPARESLTPEWPQRVTPSDLPSLGDTEGLERAARLLPEPAPLVVELRVGGGRHRLGSAPGTQAQRVRWDSPTGQFWLLVANLNDLSEPCTHCASPEDGERPHAGCPGCACPCSMVEAAA